MPGSPQPLSPTPPVAANPVPEVVRIELHTLGVGGGYSKSDVTRFAEVLTG